MPYLNVDEVESALVVASSGSYSAFTSLIPLPFPTWEGRQCHAIRMGNSSSGGIRPAVFLLGGVHAREWGSADILINFVEQLEQAYTTNSSLTFGTRTFSAAEIHKLVDRLDIIVFPQANPDGRYLSMNEEPLWRKNRRVAAPNSPQCPGVDLNRNYDFLWDFPRYFSPSSAISDSTDPCNPEVYHGPSAFSEPETQNVKWIFDHFPNIGYFIDLHSYSQDILYTWGDDQNQSSEPSMNFRNPLYDGMRGVGDDTYKEYIPTTELATALRLANTLYDGIKAFRGTTYTVKSGFELYPTAGAADDYAYSRHFVDGGKSNILSYTLEWGLEFQPPYSEMHNIIQEVSCGLLEFCLKVCPARLQVTYDPAPIPWVIPPHPRSPQRRPGHARISLTIQAIDGDTAIPVAGTVTSNHTDSSGLVNDPNNLNMPTNTPKSVMLWQATSDEVPPGHPPLFLSPGIKVSAPGYEDVFLTLD